MKFIFILIVLTPFLGFTKQTNLQQAPSREDYKKISEHNLELSLRSQHSRNQPPLNHSTINPFFEGSTTGYLAMSDDNSYGSQEIKDRITKHLPENVHLLIYTQERSAVSRILNHYSKLISHKRLSVVKLAAGGRTNFWTRDNLPFPIWIDGDFALSDARYYYNFEPDTEFQSLWDTKLLQHDYFFEGGNLITNNKNHCIIVNRNRRYPSGVSDTAAIPDQVFKFNYGCKKLIRLKHLKGIGHADEVVKFMDNNTVLTDTKSYVKILEDEGYKVLLLPEPRSPYGTYINSIIVNNTIFVPIYNESNDQKALKLYQDLNENYNIIPIDSKKLSRRGQGSLHCITMNYPPVEFQDLSKVFTKLSK